MFEVDYSLYMPEFGVENVDADSAEDAEVTVLQRLKELYPEAINIEIEMVRKI